MIKEDWARRLLDETVAFSPADGTEVVLSGGKLFLTRFADNRIHQNLLKKDYRLMVKTILGNKAGVASRNIFDGIELKRLVDDAMEITRLQKDDPELPPLKSMPEPHEPIANSYDDKLMQVTPEEKSTILKDYFQRSASSNLNMSGSFVTSDQMLAYANSAGTFRYHKWTSTFIILLLKAADGRIGWTEEHCHSFNCLDIESRFNEAMAKVMVPGEPGEIPAGRYTVVLEEMAVSFLWHLLAYDGLSSLALEQGRSFFTDQIGKKITGANISLYDNTYHPLLLGDPFDYEGDPRKKVVLIDKGVASGVTYDRRTAARAGVASTGHALPHGTPDGAYPRNLVLSPGDTPRQDMLKGIDRGILVTRLWYVNTRDERKALLTGMTRGGTFLVENGVPVRPLKNLRFNEPIMEAFSRVSAISNSQRVCGSEFGGWGAFPCVRIEDFNITGCSISI